MVEANIRYRVGTFLIKVFVWDSAFVLDVCKKIDI